MARIAGTGKPRERRIRVPKVNLDPIVVVVLFSPVAILAPNDFLRALAVAGAVLASWFVGFYEGRAAHAREVLRDLRRDDGAA
jgi:hypothetical protein